VRDARRRLLGNAGVELSDGAVPRAIRHLLPCASLLSTDEEGALLEFWEVMGRETRNQVMDAIGPLMDEICAFGIGRDEESVPIMNPSIAEGLQSTQRDQLEALMAVSLAKLKPTTAEQNAMLDLARLHDLVVLEWEE
jgi:hypothetical protein